jgi:hypothetical protein
MNKGVLHDLALRRTIAKTLDSWQREQFVGCAVRITVQYQVTMDAAPSTAYWRDSE